MIGLRLAGALSALVAIACSSTNEARNVATRPDATAAASVAGEDGTTPSPGPSGVRGGATAGGASTAAPGSTATGSAAARDTSPIRIGMHYSTNLDAAFALFGAQGEFVDFDAAINKLVAYVNRNGGLGGRKIRAFLHATDPLEGTFPAQAERACTYFADDAKVSFVVSGAILPDDNMPACHSKRGIPLIWSYQYLLNKQAFQRYPEHLYMPHMIGTHRFGFYIDALKGAGYFDNGAKIGLLRYDNAVHKEFADAVVKAGLKRHGLKLTSEAAITKPQSAGEASQSANQMGSAMLRFRSTGVTHLLFSPSGGAMPLLYGPLSDSQDFYPRLAFNSLDIPQFVTDNLSARQLDRAVTIGWMPTNDTYIQHAENTPVLERCKTATGIRNDTDMIRFCDGLFFLKDALDRNPLSGVAGLRRAVEALGERFDSPWSLATKLGPGRHDGASSYRLMRYKESCGCFEYVGAERAVP